MSKDSHVLVAFAKLEDRRELSTMARQALLESDIRDAMARAARKLHDEATKINAGGRGFRWDLETISYDIAKIAEGGVRLGDKREAVPTIVATMKVSR